MGLWNTLHPDIDLKARKIYRPVQYLFLMFHEVWDLFPSSSLMLNPFCYVLSCHSRSWRIESWFKHYSVFFMFLEHGYHRQKYMNHTFDNTKMIMFVTEFKNVSKVTSKLVESVFWMFEWALYIWERARRDKWNVLH